MPPYAAPLPSDLADLPIRTRQLTNKSRLRRSDVFSPHHGVWIRAGGPADWTAAAGDTTAWVLRCRALAALLPPHVGFGSLTAARMWGLPLPSLPLVEPLHTVALGGRWAPVRPDVVGRRVIDPRAHLVVRDGLPLLDMGTLLCHLAMRLSRNDLVAAIDAALHIPVFAEPGRPWLERASLLDRVAEYHGRGKRLVAEAVEYARTGAESRPETLLRLTLGDARLPEPRLNVDIRSASGTFLGRGDLVYDDYRVVVEYDGDQHRTDTVVFDRDVQRLDGLAAAGWRVIRVTGRSLFTDPQGVVNRTRRALIAGGWDGRLTLSP